MKFILNYLIPAALLLSNHLIAQDDFQKWLQRDKESFNEFLSKEDEQFIGFLSENWKSYELDTVRDNDINPKPVTIPQVNKETPDLFNKLKEELPIREVVKPKAEIANTKPPAKEIIKPKIERAGTKIIKTNFYNRSLDWEIPNEFVLTDVTVTGKEDFGKFWEEVGTLNYKHILGQLLEYKEKLSLNDWGYLLLINNLCREISFSSKELKDLLDWFFLVKSGYKAKAGLINGKIYLLIPSENKIYKTPFYNTDKENIKLYVINIDNIGNRIEGELLTYDNDYPGVKKIFDLNISSSPKLGEEVFRKELKFTYDNQEYSLTAACNKALVDFYEFYPNTDLPVYFNSSVEYNLRNALLKSFTNIIKDKPEPVAVDMILRFVQTAFGYKTDKENFQREKPLFKEETIYYDNSDCEDRAVLFSYLVKELVGLEVIGLDYPGHVSTAVKFNIDIPGESITYKNKKYTVCDPTYIGAYIGLGMPQFKNAELENIIELTDKKNNFY